MAQVLALIWATSTPGTIRSRSGRFVAPERPISSWVMTNIAVATCDIFCSFFETEVTSMFIRSSMFIAARSAVWATRAWGCCAPTTPHTAQNINKPPMSAIDLFICEREVLHPSRFGLRSHQPMRTYPGFGSPLVVVTNFWYPLDSGAQGSPNWRTQFDIKFFIFSYLRDKEGLMKADFPFPSSISVSSAPD